MRVYYDLWTNDEYFSDASKMTLHDGIVYEVESRIISVDDGINPTLLGANPSTEEEGEGLDDGVRKINDIKDSNNLVPMDLASEKDFLKILKPILKKLVDQAESDGFNPEDYKKKVLDFIADVRKDFSNHSFYLGPNHDDNGLLIISRWGDNGIDENFFFFKHGLRDEKF